MRSKSLFHAAIALAGICSWLASPAHAADPKSKAAADKKKAAELHTDEKSMKKQLSWEDKVMGPDTKRAELEKIARAHAINEKAEKEKERQAALEPAPAPAKAPAKKTEVSLPSAPEEKSNVAPREVSPKLETASAMATPTPVKPADDKFIDKLLKEEHPTGSKKKASASDRELENLLAGVKSSGRKRGDSVDDVLKAADKAPAMPAPRAQSALPEWTKTPEIAPSAPPPPSPVAAKPAKKDDGVIQVVQGAASFAPPPPPPPVAATTRSSTSRKVAGRTAPAKAAPEWNDPFADKKSFNGREDRFTPAASVNRKETASRPAPAEGWNDPFADAPEVRKASKRTATPPAPAATAPAPAPKREKSEPAARPSGGPGSAGWKDPFTKAPAEPARAHVAMRELGKNESSKWEIAAHRAPARVATTDAHPARGWSVLKKHAR